MSSESEPAVDTPVEVFASLIECLLLILDFGFFPPHLGESSLATFQDRSLLFELLHWVGLLTDLCRSLVSAYSGLRRIQLDKFTRLSASSETQAGCLNVSSSTVWMKSSKNVSDAKYFWFNSSVVRELFGRNF